MDKFNQLEELDRLAYSFGEVTKMIDCSKTKNYIRERKRMCNALKKKGCYSCSFFNRIAGCIAKSIEEADAERAIKIVQDWSDEHPQKSYLIDFLDKHPNAPLDGNGTPRFCPYDLGYMTKEDCYYMTTKEDFDDRSQYCKQCWNTPIEESKVRLAE